MEEEACVREWALYLDEVKSLIKYRLEGLSKWFKMKHTCDTGNALFVHELGLEYLCDHK